MDSVSIADVLFCEVTAFPVESVNVWDFHCVVYAGFIIEAERPHLEGDSAIRPITDRLYDGAFLSTNLWLGSHLDSIVNY